MPGEFFFMALGGLGVSLAGFAGLIAALAPGPVADSPIASWRILNVVIGGFTLTVTGFATVALYTATGDNLGLTVRLASAIFAVITVPFSWRETRPGPAWPGEANRRFATLFYGLLIAAAVANVGVASLGLLQVLFVVYLLGPLSIFLFTVRDVAGIRR